MSDTAFSKLSLNPDMVQNLQSLGFEQLTPVQAQSLPHILQRRDLVGKAKTGSGKTVAFGIGLLEHLQPMLFSTQGLVLCPTRELATQVANELRKLARHIPNIKILTLCGGQPIGPQIGSLQHGAHVVVGTPGRIRDHLRKGTLYLDGVSTLVLDEADRMLEMGFADDLEFIINHTPRQRQTLMFSATYAQALEAMSSEYLQDPVSVEITGSKNQLQIQQRFYRVDKNAKAEATVQLLSTFRPESCLIFCNTKANCESLTTFLKQQRYSAAALHGDLDQQERDQVLTRFAGRSVSILIATDVAARGLDVDDLPCVISYDLTRDTDVHTHRIGRTGRAGKKGMALSLVTDSETYKVEAIGEALAAEFKISQLPPGKPDYLPAKPAMVTLCIAAGRKNKIRPGDILGALTGDSGIAGSQVGKINIFDFASYVAVNREAAPQALKHLTSSRIKGRRYRAKRI